MTVYFVEEDPSSGAVSSRVWVRYPVMTLVPFSKALAHSCFIILHIVNKSVVDINCVTKLTDSYTLNHTFTHHDQIRKIVLKTAHSKTSEHRPKFYNG